MKNRINFLAVVCALVAFALGCNASFTTASISSFNTGKNEKAEPATSSFELGEKVYAVAIISNTMSKHKITFKVFYENVQGKTKGEEAFKKDLDFEGSRPVYLIVDATVPGDFRVDAALMDENGKEIEKKSTNFTVKGGSTSTSEKSKPTPGTEKDSEDQSDDK